MIVVLLLGLAFVTVAVLGVAALFWYKGWHKDGRGFPVEPPRDKGAEK